jgi:hypothetical protein
MRVTLGAITLALTLLSGARALEAQQLRADSYRWYFGVQAGGLLFETQTQDRSALPVGGIHALVLGKRIGLSVSIEEGFGSGERSAYADVAAPEGSREVSFDRLRKYMATMLAFPLDGDLEPYLGVGFGILHTVNTRVEGFVTSPDEGWVHSVAAKDLGSTGVGSLLGGVQYRVSPGLVVFGHYQITTSPEDGRLLRGPSHTVAGGVRLGLGRAREDVRGGGY